MKILAIILIILSLSKLLFSLAKGWEDATVSIDVPWDPEIIKGIFRASIVGDGLVGLFCGLFILAL